MKHSETTPSLETTVHPGADGPPFSHATSLRQLGMIVSHTHWDREWRYPIWETRFHLQQMMDELIALLEKGVYSNFLLDGQTVIVDDYLMFRPDMARRIEALVRDGKLSIGPWYTLPDLSVIDAECVVRNLLWGRRRADALGGCMKIGYTTFGWGLPAQFPQILAGFDIRFITISKYLDPRRLEHNEFVWRAPDGTEALATIIGEHARAGFFFSCYQDILVGRRYLGEDWKYDFSAGRLPFHRADPPAAHRDYCLLEPPRGLHPELANRSTVDQCMRNTDGSLMRHTRLMMNGTDSIFPSSIFPKLVETVNQVDPDRQFVQASLAEYVDVLQAELHQEHLQVVQGELRDGPAAKVSGNALSTRLYIKQMNRRAENALLRNAEPLAVASWLSGQEYPEEFLNKAWNFMLKAHCHDSINGVTLDKTARDTVGRLDQVLDLANGTTNSALRYIVRQMNLVIQDERETLLVIFNYLPRQRREVAVAYVDFPVDWNVDLFEFVNPEGERLAVQTLNKSIINVPAWSDLHRAFPFHVERHEVAFDTGPLAACGYTVLRAVPTRFKDRTKVIWHDPVPVRNQIAPNSRTLENECVRIQINENGTFDLHDKVNQTVYRGLNYFEDTGDAGDYWVRTEPCRNRTVNSIGSRARIELIENGELRASIAVTVSLHVPDRDAQDDLSRELDLHYRVTLQAGRPEVEVEVWFENRIPNHRLQVMFPTGLSDAVRIVAETHFATNRKPFLIKRLEDDAFYLDMQSQPMGRFLDIADRERGLAIISNSLTEYQGCNDQEKTVGLTLLRSVKNEMCAEFRTVAENADENGGQCFGRHRASYTLLAHGADATQALIAQLADRHGTPLVMVQTMANPGPLPGTRFSWFELIGERVRLSTIKRAHDRPSVIVRLYNPTDAEACAELRSAMRLTASWITDLNEERKRELEILNDRQVRLTLEHHKIATVELVVDRD